MTFDIDAIAAELTEDGDHVEIPSDDGTWTFRLHIDPDDISYEDIEDDSVFGRIAYVDNWGRAWFKGRRSEPRQRPPGFTGAARKMTSEAYPGDQWWYEPPAEFRRFKGSGWETIEDWESARRLHQRNVRSIISWGYVYVAITAEHRLPDGYHHEWHAGLGGIEAEYDEAFLADIVGDLLHELVAEIDTDTTVSS